MIGLDCHIRNRLQAHMTGGNSYRFSKATDSSLAHRACTAQMTGKCCPWGLWKGLIAGDVSTYKQPPPHGPILTCFNIKMVSLGIIIPIIKIILLSRGFLDFLVRRHLNIETSSSKLTTIVTSDGNAGVMSNKCPYYQRLLDNTYQCFVPTIPFSPHSGFWNKCVL